MNSGSDIILVVDDDFAVRESLKFALELEGLVVHACGSGMELLRHPDPVASALSYFGIIECRLSTDLR